MNFDPKTDKYPYTEYTDQHYLVVKKNDGAVFDKNYPYIDDSKWFRFKEFLMRIALYTVAFPVCAIRMGLRIKGRENIKKYKDVLKSGVISCSNHVFMWDYIAVMNAIRPFRSHILAWDINMRGENKGLIRYNGGIPVPVGDVNATIASMKAIRDMLNSGGWLHIYAEGSMWEFYAPIRPFKSGTAHFACKFDKPVLPLAFSYRKPGAIWKHIFRQIARFNLTVGEPLYPDKTLQGKERELDLTRRCHAAVCRLAGIDPGENIYPPVFDHNKRIDYYTTEYGKKSK